MWTHIDQYEILFTARDDMDAQNLSTLALHNLFLLGNFLPIQLFDALASSGAFDKAVKLPQKRNDKK